MADFEHPFAMTDSPLSLYCQWCTPLKTVMFFSDTLSISSHSLHWRDWMSNCCQEISCTMSNNLVCFGWQCLIAVLTLARCSYGKFYCGQVGLNFQAFCDFQGKFWEMWILHYPRSISDSLKFEGLSPFTSLEGGLLVAPGLAVSVWIQCLP